MSGDGAAGDIPIGGGTCPAKLARARAIKQESKSVVILVKRGERKIRGGSKSLDDRNGAGDFGNHGGSLITVELRGSESHKGVKRINFRRLGVNEKTDRLDARRKLRAHRGRFNSGNTSETLLVEIEAQHVGARVAGGLGVRPIGDATDLDEDHGGLYRERGAAEESSKGDRGIGRKHETLADEKGVEASVAESGKIVVGAQPGFADGDAGVGNALDEFERCFHV